MRSYVRQEPSEMRETSMPLWPSGLVGSPAIAGELNRPRTQLFMQFAAILPMDDKIH
jgi:hypothetical protein